VGNAELVPTFAADADRRAIRPETQARSIDIANSSEESSQTGVNTDFDGPVLSQGKFVEKWTSGLGAAVTDICLKSWRPPTITQYGVYWKQWKTFCFDRNIDWHDADACVD
jgi:hypothetical protein